MLLGRYFDDLGGYLVVTARYYSLPGVYCWLPLLTTYSQFKYEGNNTEEWWKNWKVVDLAFLNWYKKLDEFWLKHSEVLKNCNLMACFRPKYIAFELKKYRGVIFHYTEEWCKIWRGLTCQFKIDMRILTNFDLSILKSQKAAI